MDMSLLIIVIIIIIFWVLAWKKQEKKIITQTVAHCDKTYYESNIAHHFPSYDPTRCYVNARIPIDAFPKTLPSHTIMRNLLCKNKIYIRPSHIDNGYMGVYQTSISLCTICMKKLDLHAFFVDKYYFCFSCLKEAIKSLQIDKFLLVRELLNDTAMLITMYMIYLTFDVEQIIKYAYECKSCKIFDCKKEVKCDFTIDDFKQYTRLMIQ